MQFYSDELAMAVRARRRQQPTKETSTTVTAARNRVSRSTIRARQNNDSNYNANIGSSYGSYYAQESASRVSSRAPSRSQSRAPSRAQSRLSSRSAHHARPAPPQQQQQNQSAVSMARSRVSAVRPRRYAAPPPPQQEQHNNNASYLSESIYTSLSRASSRDTWEQGNWDDDELSNLPPAAVAYTTTAYSTASVDTYDSTLSDEDETHVNYYRDDEGGNHSSSSSPSSSSSTSSYSAGIPPAVLPPYQCVPMMSETATVRSSDPESFAHLFPSMARLSIRHDERTADGNMNLRVDTIIPDPASRRRRPVAVQLFHLRMHDLARRDFSLRRYCRDSGREVCSSKGAVPRNPADPRPGFQHQVTSAIRSMKTSFRRSSNAGAHSNAANSNNHNNNNNNNGNAASVTGSPDPRRPSVASNSSWNCSAAAADDEHPGDAQRPPAQRPIPANTIKLEFSNYARVEIVRHRHKAYEFEWWGHKYAWRRVVDKGLGRIAYHLIRDGAGAPVAIIVPEGRSPTQIEADENAGSWIPPCHMWISDRSVIEVMTDVADVVVATGLMALVDDCIRQRWPAKKPRSTSVSANVGQQAAQPVVNERPRTFMHGLFHRQRLQQHYAYSPLRIGNAVTAY